MYDLTREYPPKVLEAISVNLGVNNFIVEKIRQKLNKDQKAILKYCFSALRMWHLKTFLFRNEKFGVSVYQLFESLRPLKTEYQLVRRGGLADGSYLVPDAPINYQGVISPGVGQTFEFEKEIVPESIKVILIDGTIPKPDNLPVNFIFRKEMLTEKTSTSLGEVTLSDLVLQEFPKKDLLLLSMDIEGAEYKVISTTSIATLSKFAVLVIEFHQLQKVFVSKSNNEEITRVFNKLKGEFHLLHSHPNNAGGFFLYRLKKIPKVIETTWIRKDLAKKNFGPASIPHNLDVCNDLQIKDLKFPVFKNRYI